MKWLHLWIITAGMFEVSAHACFHNEANLSVHLLQSKCCCPSCCSNANKSTVFTNLLRWNDTGRPEMFGFQFTFWLIILRCLEEKWKIVTWLSSIAWHSKMLHQSKKSIFLVSELKERRQKSTLVSVQYLLSIVEVLRQFLKHRHFMIY